MSRGVLLPVGLASVFFFFGFFVFFQLCFFFNQTYLQELSVVSRF